jgi:hypothetical protein
MNIYIPNPANTNMEPDRTEVKMKVDTPEGKFALPVVVIADFQVDLIVAKLKQAIWGGVAESQNANEHRPQGE